MLGIRPHPGRHVDCFSQTPLQDHPVLVLIYVVDPRAGTAHGRFPPWNDIYPFPYINCLYISFRSAFVFRSALFPFRARVLFRALRLRLSCCLCEAAS